MRVVDSSTYRDRIGRYCTLVVLLYLELFFNLPTLAGLGLALTPIYIYLDCGFCAAGSIPGRVAAI